MRLLGRFEIAAGTMVLTDEDFTRRRKSSWLLKLLALAPSRVLNRDQVLEQLWANGGAESARSDLYKQLHFLRSVLDGAGLVEDLVSLKGSLFSLCPDVLIDVDEFRRLARLALDRATDAAAYERALDLWRGELLPGELYEHWTEPYRDELRRTRHQLVHKLADVYEIRGEWESAAKLLRGIQDGPTDEETTRALMRVHALAQDPESAIALYVRCRDALADDLAVEPSTETNDLYARINSVDSAGTTRVLGSADTPLVGRESELTQMRRLLAETTAGRGGVATIEGEAGIGKTRLLQAFVEYARLKGAQVAVGRCLRDQGAPPYHAWIEILREVLPAVERGSLPAVIGPGVDELRELLPELSELFESLPAGPRLSGERARFRLFDTINRLLDVASRRSPLVIAVEDLHDADASTLELLHSVARTLSNRRVLLVITHRIGEELHREPLQHTLSELLRVGPRARIEPSMLSENEVRQLLELVAEAPITDLRAGQIAVASGGNPLYAREYARLLSAESSAAQLSVPRSIQGIITERTRSFSAACTDFLSAAAAVGTRFDTWLLSRVANSTPSEVIEALEEALRANIVRRHGDRLDEFEFTHDVLRKSLYAQIAPTRLGSLHTSIGEAIESLAERDSHLAQLAYHFDRSAQLGGDIEKAIGYMMRAGDEARSRFAWSEARASWESALNLMDRGPVDPRQVADLLERLEDLIFSNGGDYQEGLGYLERALRVRQELGDEERVAQIHSRLGRALSTHIGDVRYARYMDIPRAIEHYRAAEAVLTRGPERPAVVYFYAGLASAAYNGMRIADGLDASKRAMDAARALGMDALWSTAALLRGSMLKASGHLKEAHQMLEGAYEIADARNDPLVSYYAITNIADWTDGYRAGNGELYERELDKKRFATAQAQRTGLLEDLGCALCLNGRLREAEQIKIENQEGFFFGMLRFCAGDWNRAAEIWHQGFETLAAVGHDAAYVNRAHQIAALSYARGRSGEAERLLREELKMSIQGGATLIELRARIALALVCLDSSQLVPEAPHHVDRCRSIVTDGEDWGVYRGRVAMIDGVLASVEGDVATARARFADAAVVFERAELVWERAEVDLHRARAEARAGQLSEATKSLRESKRLYRRIGAGEPWLQRARGFIRHL